MIEGSVTLVAGIWSFTSVRVNMVLETGRENRRIRTMGTGVQDHAPDLDGDTTGDDDF